MKFKILDIKQVGDNLQVAVQHEFEEREVFGLPLDTYEDDKFVQIIQDILNKRYSVPELSIDKKKFEGREFGA